MLPYLFCLLLFSACSGENSNSTNTTTVIDPKGKTIEARFNTPMGWKRITANKNSFAYYLRNLALHDDGYKVHYYNGKIKPYDVYHAVIKMDVGDQDLQQCADAVMRLRVEYLFLHQRFEDIHFTFTDGFNANYSKWREGFRIVSGARGTRWIKTNEESASYASFRNYMNVVFMYAGTLSLSKQLKQKPIENIMPGDVFIKGGSPGHAVLAIDVSVNDAGQKIFMLAQSYMPAQEIHVLKNYYDRTNSPWYSIDQIQKLQTPEWTFTVDQLKGWE
jgi:hypothetical protein